MFDIGWTEILILATVSLFVIGPKEIPKFLGYIGKMIAKVRGISRDLQDSVDDAIKNSELEDIRKEISFTDPELSKNFNEIIKNPSINDLGYKDHINLLKYMNYHEIEPIVIDSKNILLNPRKELKKLCNKINIEFQESMLSWKSGPKKEDGIWAKYWYNNVHLSTGFNKYKAKTKKFPIHLEPLLKECQKYYRELTDLI